MLARARQRQGDRLHAFFFAFRVAAEVQLAIFRHHLLYAACSSAMSTASGGVPGQAKMKEKAAAKMCMNMSGTSPMNLPAVYA